MHVRLDCVVWRRLKLAKERAMLGVCESNRVEDNRRVRKDCFFSSFYLWPGSKTMTVMVGLENDDFIAFVGHLSVMSVLPNMRPDL